MATTRSAPRENDLELAPGSFLGRRLGRRAVSDFILTEAVYAPSAHLAPHTHAHAYYSLLLSGAYDETSEGRVRECVPATVVFHTPGESHSDRFRAAGGRLFCVEIGPSWLDRVRSYGAALDEPAHVTGGAMAWIAQRLYREFKADDLASSLAIEGLALELASESTRLAAAPSRHAPAWLTRAEELLRDRFLEEVRISEIAVEIGVHPVHFTRAFRAFAGCTPGEFVRRLRLDYAARLILTTRRSIVDVALACGFSSQSHFTTAFKRHTGLTPAAYRATAARR